MSKPSDFKEKLLSNRDSLNNKWLSGKNRSSIAYVVIITWVHIDDSKLNHLYESKWVIDVVIAYRWFKRKNNWFLVR